MTKKVKSEALSDRKFYEVAWLSAPSLTPDGVAQLEELIKKQIGDLAGEVTGNQTGQLINLAYPIKQILSNKRNKFNQAYFGALRFELAPEATISLKDFLSRQENIIRFLLVVLPTGADKNLTIYPRRMMNVNNDFKLPEEFMTVKTADQPEKETKKEKIVLSSEEIDKEIEGLLGETPAEEGSQAI